jgi:hypothetical protein
MKSLLNRGSSTSTEWYARVGDRIGAQVSLVSYFRAGYSHVFYSKVDVICGKQEALGEALLSVVVPQRLQKRGTNCRGSKDMTTPLAAAGNNEHEPSRLACTSLPPSLLSCHKEYSPVV